jgi:uncharacterized membrane protein YqiK
MFKAWAWGTYIFFAVFLAGGFAWVWWYLPETKNRTLEEMDRVFGSHSSEADARLLAQAQTDVGLTAFLNRSSDSKSEVVEHGTDHVEKMES